SRIPICKQEKKDGEKVKLLITPPRHKLSLLSIPTSHPLQHHHTLPFPMLSRTVYKRFKMSSTTSVVLAFPPRSGVNTLPSKRFPSTALYTLWASSFNPRNSSKRPVDLAVAIGLAIPLPSISGAEPWHGSPITKSSPTLADGTSPREPTRAAAPSDRMSP